MPVTACIDLEIICLKLVIGSIGNDQMTDSVLSVLFPDYQLLQKLQFISASHQYMHWPSRRPAVCPGCGKFFKFKYNMKIHLKKCVAAQGHLGGGMLGGSGGDEVAAHPSLPPPPPPPPHPHGAHSTSWLAVPSHDAPSTNISTTPPLSPPPPLLPLSSNLPHSPSLLATLAARRQATAGERKWYPY